MSSAYMISVLGQTDLYDMQHVHAPMRVLQFSPLQHHASSNFGSVATKDTISGKEIA